jgi:peptidyl-prolyl cis-trans isomerase SurA
MLLRVVTLFSAALALLLVSCAPKHSEVVLAEYGGQKVTMEEFENVYAKNAGGMDKVKADSLDSEKLRNFLDLYVNFKMKLRDAKVRGYADNAELNAELLDYKKKVGVSYLLEKQLVEPGVEELYKRRMTELRVSHIMIRPDTLSDEETNLYAQRILDSIKAGASFEDMVTRHTHDQYSRSTGGDIFYVTAGMLPPNFEDASYNTPVGEVYPEVVKTNFGYHIIKVTERQERVPEIRASHILIGLNNAEGENDSAAARQKADSIRTAILNGADFSEMVMQYSEDTGSKINGGDLGFFQRRMMIKEFDETAFKLDIDEVSDVVKTHYGYHIIKLTDKKPNPTLEESRDELKNLYKQIKYNEEHAQLVENLKQKYSYQLNEGSVEVAAARTDTLKVNEKLGEAVNGIKDQPLFTYAEKTVTTGEFLDRVIYSTDYTNKIADKDFYYDALKKVSADFLLEEEAMNLENTNPEFASLMEDYRNGIYIFKLQDEQVWSQVKTDSVRLLSFYENNKEKYTYPDRVNFSEIFTRNDSLAGYYYALLQNGADFEEVAEKYTERPGMKDKKGNYGLTDLKDSRNGKLAEAAAKLEPGTYSEPQTITGGYSIIKLNSIEEARIKTFEEAKAEVSGAFQEAESKRIEQEYLESLKKRYKPEIFYDKLDQAFKAE